jgi:hypothetical protein
MMRSTRSGGGAAALPLRAQGQRAPDLSLHDLRDAPRGLPRLHAVGAWLDL